jgi:MFS family permease
VRPGWPTVSSAGKPGRLSTGPFVFICLAAAFFYLSFYLILPVMPLYVQGLGGTPTQIGLLIGYFAAMAMVLRLPAGWLIDRRGSRPILWIGMAIFLLAPLGYTLVDAVGPILWLRLVHGIGMGLFPTAAAVVVAELSPAERRGEAMGWFGIASSIGLIVGPAAGPVIASHLGFTALFLLCGGMAGLGLLCLFPLPAAVRRPGSAGWRIRWLDVFSPPAVLPSSILLFLYVPYGTLVAFAPIIASARGLGNAGFFYTAFAAAMLLVRSKAGELSDRRGRAAVIIPGMLVAAGALVLLALAKGAAGVLAAGVVFGIGFGAVQPALLALTTDRVAEADRGKAMGTFFTAWEAGIALGAAASGWLLTYTDFTLLLLTGAVLPVAGAIVALKARG